MFERGDIVCVVGENLPEHWLGTIGTVELPYFEISGRVAVKCHRPDRHYLQEIGMWRFRPENLVKMCRGKI